MTLREMHVWFRQQAQQMGLQNARAILPEQIDLLINTAINDVVNQLIQQNIGLTNDRVITDNSKISQINAFKTLYTVKELNVLPIQFGNQSQSTFILKATDAKIGRITTNWTPSHSSEVKEPIPDNLFLVDLSINYRAVANPTTDGAYETQTITFDSDAEFTNYFPVRIIDDVYLADTLNDFVLKPRLRSPIATVYNVAVEQGVTDTIIDLYISTFKNKGNASNKSYVLDYDLLPANIRIAYVKKPAKVEYKEDLNSNGEYDDVNCDLPESMHVDILKHAVDLYRVAVNGSLYASQQQADAQNRENTRNNYRDEGYARNPQAARQSQE